MSVSKQISQSTDRRRGADLVNQTTEGLVTGLKPSKDTWWPDTQKPHPKYRQKSQQGAKCGIANSVPHVAQTVEKVLHSESCMRELAAATGEIHSIVSSIKAIADQNQSARP